MPDARLSVTVVWSPGPREVCERAVMLDAPATAQQALGASGLLAQFPAMAAEMVAVSVWGRAVAPGQLLRDGDRVEVHRPLQVDPKVARRARFRKQGARGAGLFAKKRAGAKAGY